MRKIYRTLLCGSLLLFSLGFSSCEAYLDKEADSTVSEDEAFKNFRNFQGFIEEIYNCIPDKEKNNYTTSWNWGDDEIFNPEGDSHMTHQVDLGNFRAWSTNNQCWLYRTGSDPTATYHPNSDGNAKFKHSLWPHAWYCIRKANIGIANLERLTEATDEEKKLIAGQLYFFRAWWHFEMMQYFGGLPYIDTVLSATEKMSLPRLSYQECADKAAVDFRMAADLLPINWDNTTVGKQTAGKNDLRINKIMALGYLGKNYLWAASPLMEHGAQLGGSNTYNYNTEYAKKAAEAFGELLTLVESGQTQYALAQFDYSDIYNHTKSASASNSYSEIFYTTGQNWKMPGTTEAIFRGPSEDFNGSNWNMTKLWGPKIYGLVEHDNIIHQPTANYVNLYGMENGLPLSEDETKSGFRKNFPFRNRDARFYHDIVFDGFHYVNAAIPEADKEFLRYCTLYTGGAMRAVANASRTGYFIQKLVPHQANKYDGLYNWSGNLHTYLPYMRLADIYLMYAEACAAVDGAASKSTNFGKTAEDAINTLRKRAGVGPVGGGEPGDEKGTLCPEYISNSQKFMDEVRRERAVELSFEGFRFNDLQRWLLLTEEPYTIKTSQEFERVENEDFYKNNDPAEAEVRNFREETILKRVFGTKHYWFPLLDNDVYLYAEFPQNPGW